MITAMFACPVRPLHRLAVGIAALFGVATILAGGRVLLGADAGYEVLRPVLLFNTAMGFVYLAAALLIARDLQRGMRAAFVIAFVNLLVLAFVIGSRMLGAGAAQTLTAMVARTAVWAGLALLLLRERGATTSG